MTQNTQTTARKVYDIIDAKSDAMNDIVLDKIAAHVREGLEFRIKSFTKIADAADGRAAKLEEQANRILAEAKVEKHFAAQNREAAARAREAAKGQA